MKPAQSGTYCKLNALLEKFPQSDSVILREDFNSRLQRHAGNGRVAGE